jgi:hypothetical protein
MSHDTLRPGRVIALRRDTAANWATDNPILAVGETGWTTDTRRVKLGDGVTAWVDLPFAADEAAAVTGLQDQIDAIVATAGFAVSDDGSFSLPVPTGVGFEWLFTDDELEGPYMNGVAL